mmetsp:Transcript_90758/g.157526  ORF Transcript_90758/g.157526 Transcript_90758/m.157526 type:complete len:207 (-) Transcript_90758:469-1089(-)
MADRATLGVCVALVPILEPLRKNCSVLVPDVRVLLLHSLPASLVAPSPPSEAVSALVLLSGPVLVLPSSPPSPAAAPAASSAAPELVLATSAMLLPALAPGYEPSVYHVRVDPSVPLSLTNAPPPSTLSPAWPWPTCRVPLHGSQSPRADVSAAWPRLSRIAGSCLAKLRLLSASAFRLLCPTPPAMDFVARSRDGLLAETTTTLA